MRPAFLTQSFWMKDNYMFDCQGLQIGALCTPFGEKNEPDNIMNV